MGFLLSAGTAAAHSGHVSIHGQSALSAASAVAPSENLALYSSGRSDLGLATEDLAGQAEAVIERSIPCSDDQPAGHHGTGCCAVACHAALAALPLGPIDAPEPPSLRLVGISDRLDSRSGDRTERPPKLI